MAVLVVVLNHLALVKVVVVVHHKMEALELDLEVALEEMERLHQYLVLLLSTLAEVAAVLALLQLVQQEMVGVEQERQVLDRVVTLRQTPEVVVEVLEVQQILPVAQVVLA